MVIVHDTSAEERTSERRLDANAMHFMSKPAALAFGADETTFGMLTAPSVLELRMI